MHFVSIGRKTLQEVQKSRYFMSFIFCRDIEGRLSLIGSRSPYLHTFNGHMLEGTLAKRGKHQHVVFPRADIYHEDMTQKLQVYEYVI